MESYLDERDERAENDAAAEKRLTVQWSMAGADPAERLIAFDRWVKRQLETRLVWPTDSEAKEKRIHQCRVELEHMLTQLFSRGWLLDGQRLANHVTTILDAVGAAQRAGRVNDFWPYFKAAVGRYVGANAEELQAESKRAGNVMAGVLGALGVQRQGSVVELVAQRRSEVVSEKTIRQKLAEKRRASKAAAEPLQLDFTPEK